MSCVLTQKMSHASAARPEHGVHVRELATTDMSLAIEDTCWYEPSIARPNEEDGICVMKLRPR
jgi:hypothetical protein